jgi:hypothetical protein
MTDDAGEHWNARLSAGPGDQGAVRASIEIARANVSMSRR